MESWTDRLATSLEVAACLMSSDAQASISRRLTAAVAGARAHLATPQPLDMPARRAILEMAPVVRTLAAEVRPSVPQACLRAQRNALGALRGVSAGLASAGWFMWQAAAAAFLLRTVSYALNRAKTSQRLRPASPPKRLERTLSSKLLRTAKKMWPRLLIRRENQKGRLPVRTFLFMGLLHVGLTLGFVGGPYLTSFASVNPGSGAISGVDYYNPAIAAAKADALSRLVSTSW